MWIGLKGTVELGKGKEKTSVYLAEQLAKEELALRYV